MASSYVKSGVNRLRQLNIVPVYDGSYFDEESQEWHDTWTMKSESKDEIYMLDKGRVTSSLICTCKAASDFAKTCKHRMRLLQYLNASLV